MTEREGIFPLDQVLLIRVITTLSAIGFDVRWHRLPLAENRRKTGQNGEKIPRNGAKRGTPPGMEIT